MDPIGLGTAGLPREAGGGTTPRNLEEAAAAFEGLLVAQLLRMAREAGESTESSDAGALREYAEEQFASQIAAGGGLGFARTVLASLRQRSGVEPRQ